MDRTVENTGSPCHIIIRYYLLLLYRISTYFVVILQQPAVFTFSSGSLPYWPERCELWRWFSVLLIVAILEAKVTGCLLTGGYGVSKGNFERRMRRQTFGKWR